MPFSILELHNKPIQGESDELHPSCGPAHDIKILERFMALNRIPNRLLPLCLPWVQLQLQSHLDSVPVCIIRYRLTNKAAELLRNLMTAGPIVKLLNDCRIHVSLVGSEFDQEICCRRKNSNDDLEVQILQPTMSSSRMVVGDIISGNDGRFAEILTRAIEDALQAAQAVQAQRELLERNRELIRSQEEDLRISESTDRNKTNRVNEKRDEGQDKEEEEKEENERESTLPDSEEMRRKRVAAISVQVGQSSEENPSKRQSENEDEDDEGEEGNESGTVTLKENM